MKDRTSLTAARLRELLHYDADSGVFTWASGRSGRAGKGGTAGTRAKSGKTLICVAGVDYPAEELAWLWMTGELPPRAVCHANEVKGDYTWSNLRLTLTANASTSLSAERLRNLLSYDPETGLFVWKVNRGGTALAGSPAGTVGNHGYVIISVGPRRWLAHRLAWLYVTGEQPPPEIDHINGDRLDNRWANIRSVDRAGNCENLHGAQVNNSTGYLGVSPDPKSGTFIATIVHDRQSAFLGRFDTPELAHAAYLGAKRAIHRFGTI
jgi:hypothetical protein